MSSNHLQRRHFIRTSAFGLIGVSAFGYAQGNTLSYRKPNSNNESTVFYRYPSMDDEMVASVVGASHNNYDKVKEMVSQRPELSGAAWDWGFGDWETALGAASHVGRRDIAELLIAHGARPDIFTYTMLGILKSVQEIVETIPGIQTHRGPHGITLLQHAKNRLSNKDITEADKKNVGQVLNYLESLGNADIKATNLEMTNEEMQKYVGEYRFGAGEDEIFVVQVNTKDIMQIARKGMSPRNLNKVDENGFSPVGATSVKIVFKTENNKAIALTVHEPEPVIVASRI